MAIRSAAIDLKDMRERMGKIVVAYTKKGKPVTTEDLGVAGAMTAWMVAAATISLRVATERTLSYFSATRTVTPWWTT